MENDNKSVAIPTLDELAANETNNKLALIQPEDLSLIEDNVLNGEQLKQILKRTPKQYVHERPARGGGKWQYVTGGYVRKVLNLMFGWNWDFEIISDQIVEGEVIVKGRLTCRSGEKQITKMQYGNKEIIYRKSDNTPLSIGNDMKAAATDCLKKCAAELGIAADIYNAQDFKEVNVEVIYLEELEALYELKKESANLPTNFHENYKRVVETKEDKSYTKFYNILKES